MTFNHFCEVLLTILSSRRAQALSLSKGGWEGWLQCELWNAVGDAGTTIERERKYPGYNQFCDLVCVLDLSEHWIEIKAFGQFQEAKARVFLDTFANDVLKLEGAPKDAQKIAALIVSNNIGGSLIEMVKSRWGGVQILMTNSMTIFLVRF